MSLEKQAHPAPSLCPLTPCPSSTPLQLGTADSSPNLSSGRSSRPSALDCGLARVLLGLGMAIRVCQTPWVVPAESAVRKELSFPVFEQGNYHCKSIILCTARRENQHQVLHSPCICHCRVTCECPNQLLQGGWTLDEEAAWAACWKALHQAHTVWLGFLLFLSHASSEAVLH